MTVHVEATQTWVVTPDTAGWLTFVSEVLGGTEISRVLTEDGGIGHAEIDLGGTVLLAFDAQPDWPDTPAMLRVFVTDVDEVLDRASRAGARVFTPAVTQAWGDRVGRMRDPQGNLWWVVEHVDDVDPAEIGPRLQRPEFAQAMREAQQTLDVELGSDGRAWSSRPVVEERER